MAWWWCTDGDVGRTVEPLDRPRAPVNVTARWLAGGAVLVSWNPGAPSYSWPGRRVRYTVEYRTVGQWVPLIDDLHNTSFVWRTASRGVTYQFRVRTCQRVRAPAAGDTSVHSHPSHAVSLLPDGLSPSSPLFVVPLSLYLRFFHTG